MILPVPVRANLFLEPELVFIFGILIVFKLLNDMEDYAKVDQLPVLEGKRMTIQLSPKKKESATKKPATPKPATPAAVKAEKPAGDNEE